MVEERYIWCRNCNEIHHVSPFDKAPAYSLAHGEETELPIDDRREFMRRHAGHRIEGLKGSGEKYFPSGRPMDPMGTRYVEVTNGQEWFVLRGLRKTIREPLNFELIRGRLRPSGATVGIRENEIRKEMKYHFSWTPSETLDDRKIDLFLEILKEVVKGLNPHEIKACGYDTQDSCTVYGLLEPPGVQALIERCRPHFDRDELKALRRFIDSHKAGDGVLALLVKHHDWIEETVK